MDIPQIKQHPVVSKFADHLDGKTMVLILDGYSGLGAHIRSE